VLVETGQVYNHRISGTELGMARATAAGFFFSFASVALAAASHEHGRD